MKRNFRALAGALVVVACAAGSVLADDVSIRPAAGDGLVVTDATGTQVRLRVEEGGGVTIRPAAGNGFLVTDATGTQVRLRADENGVVSVRPAAGSAFVVTDSAGTLERLRVGEGGSVTIRPAGAGALVVTDSTGTQVRLRVEADGVVTVRPAAGGAFEVTDSTGSQPRLRVEESGAVFLPGLTALASPGDLLCSDASDGRVGTCPDPALPIVKACHTDSESCTLIGGCPIDRTVEAVCPPGYVRLSLLGCKVPDEPTIAVTVADFPTQRDRIGCRYTGTFTLSFANMGIEMLCIANTFGPPCYSD